MDLERTPHRPELYIGGVEVDGHWIGNTLWLTSDGLYQYCEEDVEDLAVFDVCMRMVICIEEYQTIWRRISGKT